MNVLAADFGYLVLVRRVENKTGALWSTKHSSQAIITAA